MTPEQVEKSIRQMRQIFGFFGILAILGMIAMFFLKTTDSNPPTAYCCLIPLGIFYLLAYYGLGRRDSAGYELARFGSFLLLPGFPVLTLFGLIYLTKLSKPEMKQAFGKE